MNSEQIQEWVYNWASNHGFTAPYGVLKSEQVNSKGRQYRSVTFGYARTLDASVAIYNSKFMLYHSSRGESQVFKSFDDLKSFLVTL